MASYDSSSDSGRSFDEEYFQNKPPPVEYKELSHKIVVVKANNELEKENFEQNGGLKSEQTIKKTAKKRSKLVKNGINDSVVIKNVSIAENINKYHSKTGMEEIKTTLCNNNTKKVVTRTNINKSNSDKLEGLKEIVNKLTSQSEKSIDLKPVPTKRANLPLDTCQCDKCISNNYFLTQTGKNNCHVTVSNEKKIETGKYVPPTERNQFPSPYDVIKLPTVSAIVDRNKRILMENNIFPCSSTSSIKSKRTDGNIIIKKAKKEEHKSPSFRNTRDNTLKIRNEFLSPRASFSSTSSNKSNRTDRNEKFQSTNNTKATEEDKPNFISCFNCGQTVLLLLINDHLDICLHRPISPSVFSEDTLNRNLTHGTCEDLSGRDTIVLVDTFNELENGNSFCGVLKRICCCLCTK